MRIKNITKKITLATDAVEADKFSDIFFGLIFKRKPLAMVFQTRFGIHSFFMRYPIDVIVLDKKNRIIKLKTNMLPYRIFLWNTLYSTVIELPGGTIEKSRTETGDFLDFI